MSVRRLLVIAFVLFGCCQVSATAIAGQLFPPVGLPNGANGIPDTTKNCPNGQVLAWNGSNGTVQCGDPTPGVTVASCPTGQVLTGVSSGHPTCQSIALSTQTVTCNVVYTGSPDNSWYCTATCPAGTYVTGGGFNASAAYTSGGHYSLQSGNGWICDIGHIDRCTGGQELPCGSTCSAQCTSVTTAAATQ